MVIPDLVDLFLIFAVDLLSCGNEHAVDGVMRGRGVEWASEVT